MLATLSNIINRPSVSISAVVLAIWLGTMQFSFLNYLQPFGEFYIGLLQMCVLPFLLATIPLAVRSALSSGTAGKVVGQLVMAAGHGRNCRCDHGPRVHNNLQPDAAGSIHQQPDRRAVWRCGEPGGYRVRAQSRPRHRRGHDP